MAFDPDAYLAGDKVPAKAATKGFDPDAYLAGTSSPSEPAAKEGIQTTALGTLARSGAESAVQVPGIMYGAGMGAKLGTMAAGPVGGVVGGVVGGIGMGILQSMGINSLEQFADSVFGTNLVATKRAQAEQHPIAEITGGVAGFVGGPGSKMASIPQMFTKEGAKKAAVGAGAMTGIGGTMRAVEGQDVLDPKAIAADIAGGALGRPSKLGEKIFSAGRGTPATSNKPPLQDLPTEPPAGASAIEKETFLKKVEEIKAARDKTLPIVETAIKNKETGEVELMGPKHNEARKAETLDTHEQGFVDEQGNFLTRKEAWNRAKDTEQIPKDQTPESPKEGLHSGDLRKAGDSRFDLLTVPDSIDGVPVTKGLDKTREDGTRVGATTKRDASGKPVAVEVDVEHLYKQFEDKPWTKPKVEGVEPLPEDAFKTPQEWADFVIQHEAEHVKTPKAEGQSKADYENQTNKAALEAIKAKGSTPTIATPKEEPLDRTATAPRDVKDEKEFYEIAADIYAKHGDVEAIKFLEGYKEYQKTWLEPIKETEKFVGTNLKNKLANERIIHNEKRKIMEEVPDPARRIVIAEALDRGDISGLVGKEKAVAEKYQALMKDIGERAIKQGVMTGLLDDYVTHIIDWTGAPKGAREEFVQALLGTGKHDPTMKGMSPTSKFSKERKLKTFAELEKFMQEANARIEAAGKSDFRMKLKTKDLAEIYKEYALSMEKAIENKALIDSIKQIRNAAGESLVKEVNKDNPLPQGWTMMEAPQFAGYAVHPDMLPALKFVFDAGPRDLVKALGAISQLTKRLNVIGSFFHAKSLMEVLSSTGIPIWTPLKEVSLGGVDKLLGTKYSGLSKAVDQFKKGGVGDNVDKWIKEGGLQLEVPEDVSKGILGETGKFADSMIGKYGPKTRVLESSLSAVERGTLGIFDKFTWDFLHTGGKLMVADAYLDKARIQHEKNSQKSIEEAKKSTDEQLHKQALEKSKNAGWDINDDAYKGPEENKRLQDLEYKNTLERLKKQRDEALKEQPFDEAAARKEISKFVNDSFGGLNWFDAATQTRTEMGKRIAMAAYSPAGRRGLQIALFAPDWTVSTIRAFSAALPKELSPAKWHPVEGVKGMMNPTTKADYARLYQFKTALTYFTLLNAINMMTANRPIWDNKDPTRIEWPDGTSMQAMKHAMEPYHWLADPDKTLSNKLGFIPKAAVVGLAGVEYASPQAEKLVDPSGLGRLKAVGAMAMPFQAQAATGAPEGEGAKRALLGTLGFPVYGATAQQKKESRAAREKALKEAAKKYHAGEKKAGRE